MCTSQGAEKDAQLTAVDAALHAQEAHWVTVEVNIINLPIINKLKRQQKNSIHSLWKFQTTQIYF